MSHPVIDVENLSKKYSLQHKEKYYTLRDSINNVFSLRTSKTTKEEFWALKDVNFRVNEGEVLGVIGRNGAGKSTLLKVLSQITPPTSGRVRVRGRVASLLEVGTGFNSELTGRENIFLNGAILGMTRAEIVRKFDEIVEFSGVEKFLDIPVKRYSSGMQVRLAFSVAAHLEPDILVIDEVLAVGDAEFQKKCLGKMDEVTREEGRTILFVSHDLEAVRKLCHRVILLENGSVAVDGSAEDVLSYYVKSTGGIAVNKLEDRFDRRGKGNVRFVEIGFKDNSGNPVSTIASGSELEIFLKYKSENSDTLNNSKVSIVVTDRMGQDIIKLSTLMIENKYLNLTPEGNVLCLIKKLPLSPGDYRLKLCIEVNGVVQDEVESAAILTVTSGSFLENINSKSFEGWEGVLVDHCWKYK